ncbi:MAG: FAD-dependent oxidoreductase [Akkermansiaceae bacterium]|nr:FAD-dependent oxidoreductase [Akkermansiaceae bacterium]
MTEADVAVIGGGSAGLCAAVAAARAGARTVLIERSKMLGGMGTLAKVHTFCGLYHPDVSKPPVVANAGLPEEIERRMRERTGAVPVKMGKVYVLPQDPTAFAEIARELVEAEELLEVMMGVECTAITQGDGFLLETSAGSLHAKALVDASADAVVALLLGEERLSVEPERNQRSAFVFSMKGVKAEGLEDNFRMKLALGIVRAVEAGELPKEALGTAGRSSALAGEIYFTTDLDPAPSGELMAVGRDLAEKVTDFLKQNFPEYAEAEGPFCAEQPGVRETYRWGGEYLLTEEDLLKGTEFPDTVAYASWPIELRETTRGARMRYFENPVPGNIPLRALVSKNVPGVFFAGRCISATHEALASVRVMGTCFATGQAAGSAAARYQCSRK